MRDDIIGHQKILEYFDKVTEAGNLSHAYCFVGPAQVGKSTVAKILSAKLLKVEVDKLKVQPDFREINQGVDEKTGKTKKDISIEQLRRTSKFFSEYAFLGGYKIVIIDPADKMSLAAANALLKTLEEPKKNTLIFLITVDEKKLPQTIRSRCQMIYFSLVSKIEIQQALEQAGVEKAEEMARLSRGLPGLAWEWQMDRETYVDYKNEVLRFESLGGSPFYDKIKKVEELFGDKKDHVLARKKLEKILALWQILTRDLILSSLGGGTDTVHRLHNTEIFSKDDLLKIDKLILSARNELSHNIHPRLLIEQILLAIP